MEPIVNPEPPITVEKYCVVDVNPLSVIPEPLADIKTQERLPDESELKTDVPEAGEVAGQT